MADQFPKYFLDELRTQLKPSTLVGRYYKLVRAGRAGEFEVAGDSSFTISDSKQLIYDFGRTGFSGDIIAFEQERTGCTFPQAVETLASMAGLSLPNQRNSNASRENGKRLPKNNGAPPPEDADDPDSYANGNGHADGPASSGLDRWHITQVYQYCDSDGAVRYEVCRKERYVDGRKQKTFAQRRPSGDVRLPIWGLGAGEYIRTGRSDGWYAATPDRLKSWAGHIVARKIVEDTEPFLLYRWPELREETLQDPADRRVVWNVEGEKDVHTLEQWGLLATTVTGGAKNFEPHHAALLVDCDVVIIADNDQTGRKAAHAKAAALRGLAARIRVLDFRDHWPGCPEHGDVTDWMEIGGGTREKLLALTDQLPEWSPVPPDSHFNALRFIDLDRPAREMQWLVKRVITRGEVSIWYGAPGSGKSFLVADMAFAIARGVDWFGLKCRQGLVVYQIGLSEGALGTRSRFKAYRKHHNIKANENIPLVMLPSNIDLAKGDDDVNKLIEEIRAWRDYYDSGLELVIIDTFSAASPGVDEISTRDVTPILARCHKVAKECNTHVALVHHAPKKGDGPRGSSAFLGNVSSAIEIVRTEDTVDGVTETGNPVKRDVRQFTVVKQKDGADREQRFFALKLIKLGTDQDGDPITTCVIEPTGSTKSAAAKAGPPAGYAILRDSGCIVLRALVTALAERGTPPPADCMAPAYVTRVCTVQDWRDELVRLRWPPGDNDPAGDKLRQTAKKAVERTYGELQWDQPKNNVIGKSGVYVWRTTRKVWKIDDPPLASPPDDFQRHGRG